MISPKESFSVHQPILVKPIVEALVEPFLKLSLDAPPHWVVDCTLGGGGHTAALLNAFASDSRLKRHRVIAFDQDQNAIERARLRFQEPLEQGCLEVHHSRFGKVAGFLKERPTLGLLADLGFSSDQLEDPQRGLSFKAGGPLDMRLDPSNGESCRDFLKHVSESRLEEILREWGEEKFSRRIAASIIRKRNEGHPPQTTQDLVQIVVQAVPAGARHGRIHVATRTFQALRIEINQELVELDQLLDEVIPEIQVGGRAAILSFHSLEDRKVKQCFRDREGFLPLTKKPLQADDMEMEMNPRSRSAKLRIAERVRPTPC